MTWDTKKLASYGVAILITYLAFASVLRAASKPFWFDEVITFAVAKQPTLAGAFNALRDGVDSHPPTFYMVERMAGAMVPNEEIAFRLPSIIALCCTVFCIFVFVSKWCSPPCALVCAALPLVSILYSQYAVEARGYALATAFVAAALVCYQRADSRLWAILTGVSLAAASASHYYTVVAAAPLAFAEIALFWKTRRIRWCVWFALACGVVPLIVFEQLLSNLKQYYGSHYWADAQPRLSATGAFYGRLFQVSNQIGEALAVAAALGVLNTLASQRWSEGDPQGTLDAAFHEKVLALGLLALPFLFLVAMKVVHGGFVDRYLLETVLGFSLAAGCILPRFGRWSRILFGLLIFVSFVMLERSHWRSQRSNLGQVGSPEASIEELANAAGFPELPVVISDGQEYLQFAHYAGQHKANRYIGLVDLEASMTYGGTDFVDKDLLVMRRYTPLEVYEFRDFAPKNPQFLLYSGGHLPWDWWPACLLDKRYALRLLGIHGDQRIYLVTKQIAND